MIEAENESITEMEDKLRQDYSGEYLDALKNRYDDFSGHLKSLLGNGLGSDDYNRITGLQKATVVASEIVEKIWNSIHEQLSVRH